MTAALVFRNHLGADRRVTVNEHDLGALHLRRFPEGAQEKRAVSSPELGNTRRRAARISRKRIAQEIGVAHDPVDGTQIAPAARCARVVLRQVVEPFALDTPVRNVRRHALRAVRRGS